ncbi:MAG: phosphoribosyltransferase [Actinomycetota bacterium]|nr:phosphoribosyltransferase [Actinomycetota bacterium]
MPFADRRDAGRRLATALAHLADQDVVVCGLPRGGVPVAYEVAVALRAQLDVVVVRKLGFPGQPELAMGAVGEAGARFVDETTVHLSGLTSTQLAEIERRAADEVQRKAQHFRNGRDRVDRAGRTVVIVDDGIATGSTARAACQVVRAERVARVVLAVPVAPPGWVQQMGNAADEYVAVETPQRMLAVGNWYLDFSPTSDAEVVSCLAKSARSAG